MFSQKNKLKNPQNAIYEAYDESDTESEALIEEVDPNYEPTQKQVRQYAVETLGMVLPRDQGFLYLARQGLKAPLPTSWVPYQGRDGEVYYKHKITQQKTYDHPTDIEYRKKYEQSIEKMARKNLKGINAPNKIQLGLSGLGLAPSMAINNSLNNMSNISGVGLNNNSLLRSQNQVASNSSFVVQHTQFSGAGDNTITLDVQVENKYQQQLQQLENKLKRQLKQFQQEQSQMHLKKLSKLKQQFENNLKQILSNQNSPGKSGQRQIQMQKDEISKKIQKQLNQKLEQQIKQFQNENSKKLTQFQAFTQEDNKLKLFNHQQKRQAQFQAIVKKFEDKQAKLKKKNQEIRKQNQHALQIKRQQFQQQNNYQISKAIQGSLNQKIREIQQEFRMKLQARQNQLQHQYDNMRKMLGYDPNQIIRQIAEKKERLQKMSDQKISSYKNKELQIIQQTFVKELDKMKKQIETKISNEFQVEISKLKKQNDEKIKFYKEKLNIEHDELYKSGLKDLQEENQRKILHYQMTMDQKIAKIRDDTISKIQNKQHEMTEQVRNRVLLKQKQEQISNKQKIVQNIKQQIQIQRKLLKQLNVAKQLNSAGEDRVDLILQKLMKELNIVYKPKIYQIHRNKYDKLREKYRNDKDLLASIMLNLQKNSILPFYQRQKQLNLNYASSNNAQLDSISSASAILIKKYNQDVRTMRKNDQMLRQYENILKRAEVNDSQAIRILEQQDYLQGEQKTSKFNYEEILLKKDLHRKQNGGELSKDGIQQVDYEKFAKTQKFSSFSNSASQGTMQSVLDNHSKFLANVKSELNKKLFQIRSQGYSYY